MDIQQSLENQLTRKINSLNTIKVPLKADVDTIKSTISSYSGTVYDSVQLENKLESIVPTDLGFSLNPTQLLTEFKSSATNCLDEFPIIGPIIQAGGSVIENITAVPSEVIGYFTGAFSDTVHDAMGTIGVLSDVAEKTLSQGIIVVKDTLDKSGITAIISELDSLTNCYSDEGYTDILAWSNGEINSFISDLSLGDLGDFQIHTFLNDIDGIPDSLRTNLANMNDMSEDMKTQAETALSNASASVFTMIPTFKDTIGAEATNAVSTITSRLPTGWY